MKTNNHARIIDAQGREHTIACDYIFHDSGNVMLYEDHRSDVSNRTELIAYFHRPIHIELIQEP